MKEETKLDLVMLNLDNIDFDAITAVSLVDFPAIESDFMKFHKADKRNNFNFSKATTDKQIITGPALIPNKKIYRFDMYRGEYEVMFSEESIEAIRNYFLTNFKQKDVTIDHAFNANNISVVESWVIEDATNDKANALGFKDLPKGTWMLSMKVDNTEVWDMIKEGELRGFSIEAYLSQTLLDAQIQKEKIEDAETIALIDEIEAMVKESPIERQEDIIKELNEILNDVE